MSFKYMFFLFTLSQNKQRHKKERSLKILIRYHQRFFSSKLISFKYMVFLLTLSKTRQGHKKVRTLKKLLRCHKIFFLFYINFLEVYGFPVYFQTN